MLPGGDPSPHLMLCPVVGFSVPGRHGHAESSPAKGHRDERGIRALSYKEMLKAG